MVILKNKIKTVESLPPVKKKNISPITIIIIFIIIVIIGVGAYITYDKLLPYINAVNINKVVGKKTYITKCNTKDYIIIGKDKSFSLAITDDECNTQYYEGNVTLKNNTIIFNKNITGIVDDNNNIVINNNLFESEKNE